MASFTEYQRTTVEQVISIPVNNPWGACWTEVYNCLQMAGRDFQTYYGRAAGDDEIRLHVTDDAIEIIYRTGTK